MFRHDVYPTVVSHSDEPAITPSEHEESLRLVNDTFNYEEYFRVVREIGEELGDTSDEELIELMSTIASEEEAPYMPPPPEYVTPTSSASNMLISSPLMSSPQMSSPQMSSPTARRRLTYSDSEDEEQEQEQEQSPVSSVTAMCSFINTYAEGLISEIMLESNNILPALSVGGLGLGTLNRNENNVDID